MCNLAFVVACLAYVANARRLTTSAKQLQESAQKTQASEKVHEAATRYRRPDNVKQSQAYAQSGVRNGLHWLGSTLKAFNLQAAGRSPAHGRGASALAAANDKTSLHEPVRCTRVAMQLQDAFEAIVDKVKSFQKENVLDAAEVASILKADIPQILRQEPDWDVYAKDFQVIDKEGAQLQGLGATKMLTYLFRTIRKKVIVKDDIQVSVIGSSRVDDPIKPSIVVRWKVRLERPPPYEKWKEEYAVNFEVDTVFHLDDTNRVDYARIDKTFLNGREFEMWPEVKLSGNPAMFLMVLREWVMSQTKNEPEMAPFTKVQEWARDVRDVDLSASPVIRRWKSIASIAKANVSSEVDGSGKSEIQKKMDGAQEILTQMADDIECATVDEILALVFNAEESEADLLVNIYAMATATQSAIFDESGKLREVAKKLGLGEAGDYEDGRVPVLEIGEVVAMPTSQMMGPFMGGLGKELLLRIVRRAAALGRLVTIVPANEQLQKYYEKIGFEKIDTFGRGMVYSKPLPGLTDKERTFEMVRVE